MAPPIRHRWPAALPAARRLQERLRSRVVLRGGFGRPRLVAGVDVSAPRGDGRVAAAVVLLEYPSLAVREVARAAARAPLPYVPGFLSFREGPAVLAAFARLEERPDLVIFDGQGLAHPRRLGLASHLGLWLGLPSVGCAKSRLVGEAAAPGPRRGDWTSLRLDGRAVGAVVRTRDRVKPVYVSPGHLISTRGAIKAVLATGAGRRLPEPTRLAHIEVTAFWRAQR